jgi:hypothetical protein
MEGEQRGSTRRNGGRRGRPQATLNPKAQRLLPVELSFAAARRTGAPSSHPPPPWVRPPFLSFHHSFVPTPLSSPYNE